jgi:hypothetical protein
MGGRGGGGGVLKTTPKKGHDEHCLLCFVLARWCKKKVGIKQEKVGHVRWANA